MQYVLDSRLLPPGGASVQCTRCGHVFMATPHGAPPPSRSTPAVTGGAGPARSSMKSTQLFAGTPAGATAGSSVTTTQSYGAVTSKGQGADNATQAFGAVSPVAPVGTTQAFGAAPAASNPTQTFGAAPPVAPVGTTQTFGAAPAASNATQTFGAVPPVGSTQTFGAAPTTGRRTDNATQAFGAVRPVAPAPQTQAFGTMPFRGPAADAGASSQGGAPGAGTQMFGAVPPVAPVIPPVGRTQTYGTVSGQQHGAPGSAGPGSVAAGNATQTFGAYAPPQAGAFMMPDLGSVPTPPPVSPIHVGGAQVASQGSASADGAPVGFAAPPASDSVAPLGRSQTFSAVQPSASEAPVGSKRIVGSVPPVPAPASLSGEAPTSSLDAAEPSVGVRATSPFGLSPLSGADSGIQLPPESEPTATPGAGAGGLSSLNDSSASELGPLAGAATRRAPLELPPDLIASTRLSMDGARAFERGGSQRIRPRVVLASLVGLIVVASLGYVALKNRGVEIPAHVVEATDRVSVLLRRDDSTNRHQAIERLRTIAAENPGYVDVQAELAVALTLSLSDAQADAERLRLRGAAIARGLEAAAKMRVLADQVARRTSLQQEQDANAREMASLRDTVDTLRKELDVQLAQLSKAPESEPPSAATARLKARALHASVLAAPDSLALAERLRNVESAPYPWSTLARAEYALIAGSPPESLEAVARDLEALRQADSTLLRAYLLGARVALKLKDTAAARSLLDDAVALNPDHQAAARLIAQIDADAASP
ncbi:Tetratricopeptide repeat protein [Myxococcus xanthus]|nr:hypothetical protein MyxoNM_18345 [Myxococcus xanthus]SDX64199.1 hypothetical protein SAMN05444383_110169 [Myxococcus xanthus]